MKKSGIEKEKEASDPSKSTMSARYKEYRFRVLMAASIVGMTRRTPSEKLAKPSYLNSPKRSSLDSLEAIGIDIKSDSFERVQNGKSKVRIILITSRKV